MITSRLKWINDKWNVLQNEEKDLLSAPAALPSPVVEEREEMGRVKTEVWRGRGQEEKNVPCGRMNVLTMIRRLGLGPATAAPKKIARFCHSRKQKELFLIGVPFSGGQVKYRLTEICSCSKKAKKGALMFTQWIGGIVMIILKTLNVEYRNKTDFFVITVPEELFWTKSPLF